jgi:hypothetical protein
MKRGHDDLLFLCLTLKGFHGLMHLGEPVAHDNPKLCSMRKAIKSHTVATFHDDPSHVSFKLPMHKTDRLYEGSTIEIEQRQSNLDTLAIFHRYLSPRDHLQKWHPLLWLRESRVSPTRSRYIQCLRAHFPGGFAGRSPLPMSQQIAFGSRGDGHRIHS